MRRPTKGGSPLPTEDVGRRIGSERSVQHCVPRSVLPAGSRPEVVRQLGRSSCSCSSSRDSGFSAGSRWHRGLCCLEASLPGVGSRLLAIAVCRCLGCGSALGRRRGCRGSNFLGHLNSHGWRAKHVTSWPGAPTPSSAAAAGRTAGQLRLRFNHHLITTGAAAPTSRDCCGPCMRPTGGHKASHRCCVKSDSQRRFEPLQVDAHQDGQHGRVYSPAPARIQPETG